MSSTCPDCGGTGTIDRLVSLRGRPTTLPTPCTTCDATGLTTPKEEHE